MIPLEDLDIMPLAVPLGRRLLPLVLGMAYLVGTVLLFAFGPWPWPVSNPVELYGFLAAVHLALVAGYLLGSRARPRAPRRQYRVDRLVLIGSVASLLLLLPTSLSRTGRLIPDVVLGLKDPGRAYMLSQEARGHALWAEVLRMVAGPWLFVVLPLTTYYWGRLSVRVRVVAVASVVGVAAIYIAMGTNKGLVDIVLVVSTVLIARLAVSTTKGTQFARQVVVVLVCSAVMAGAIFAYFTRTQETRVGAGTVTGYDPAANVVADQSNPVVAVVPERIRRGVMAASSYLTQGYYGLSLAMREPYVPMFGLGNSMFLYLNAAELPGLESFDKKPYPVRAEHRGWSADGNWWSFYPWMASDVTFFGTVLVVGLLGWLLAVAWRGSLDGRNPFAVAMFAQLVIVVAYLPANNQAVQSGEGFFTFYGVLGLWFWVRHKRERSGVGGEGGSEDNPIPAPTHFRSSGPS
jgi:hypothetical protein